MSHGFGHTHTKKNEKQKQWRMIKNNELIEPLKEAGEFVARLGASQGSGMFEVKILNTGQTGKATIKPALRKKIRFFKEDYVLIQLDSSSPRKDKYYIIHKYSSSDIKSLIQSKQIVELIEKDTSNTVAFEDCEKTIVIDNEEQINIDDI